MFEYFLAVQGPRAEGAVLDALRRTAAGVNFDRFRAAFAYATPGGAQLLDWTLTREDPDWEDAQKRWLISFDWGHTDPRALEYLAALPKSEVRVPHAEQVLSRSLLPAVCFHPKTAVFDNRTRRNAPPAGLVVGSGNLTVSGLQTGYENASGAIWTVGHLSRDALEQLEAMRAQARELDAVWRDAAPLTGDLLRRYRDRRRRRPTVAEDISREAKTFERGYTEMDFDRTAALAAARSFWAEIGDYVVPNLGRGRPGNQIDLSRGSRVFFGFRGERVDRNTVLGPVTLRFAGGSYIHSMRFGNNYMDKLNLPIPDDEGPSEYEGTTLLFKRHPDGSFEMTVGTPADIRAWKQSSRRQGTLYQMQSGREYGVL